MRGVITDDLKKDIALIYVGVFGRAPDGEGLNYWQQEMLSKGADLRTLADWMYHAAIAHQPELSDPVKLVTNVYTNILGRPYDFEGINYWVGEIHSGKATPGQIVADILWVAAHDYKDTPHTKNLLALADIGLQVSNYVFSPDINKDNVIDQNDLKFFSSIISLKEIDLNQDGNISPDEVQKCVSSIPQRYQDYQKCPYASTGTCPDNTSIILPIGSDDDLDEDLYDFTIFYPYFPSNGNNYLIDAFMLSLIVEMFKNIPTQALTPEQKSGLQTLISSYNSMPSYIPATDLKVPNCFTAEALIKGDTPKISIKYKDGQTYYLTPIQFIALDPGIKQGLLEMANDTLNDPESTPAEIALANYTIDILAKMPVSSCPVEFVFV